MKKILLILLLLASNAYGNNICQGIQDGDMRHLCYATIYDDSRICQLISHKEIKEHCLEVASDKDDYSEVLDALTENSLINYEEENVLEKM